MRCGVALLFSMVATFSSVAQNSTIDSLKVLLTHPSEDTAATVEILFDLAEAFHQYSVDSTALYIDKAIDFSKRSNYSPGLQKGLNAQGIVASGLGDKHRAIALYQEALSLAYQLSDSNAIEKELINIGLVYQEMSKYPEAINYIKKSIHICKLLNKEDIDLNYTYLSRTYQDLGDYVSAYEQLQLALAHNEASKRSNMDVFKEIGKLFIEIGELEKAHLHFTKALHEEIKTNDKSGMLKSFKYLGLLNQMNDEYEVAKDYFRKSLVVAEERQALSEMGEVLINMGDLALQTNNLDSAAYFFNEGISLHQQTLNEKGKIDGYIGLANVEIKKGDFEDAINRASLARNMALQINTKKQLVKSSLALSEANEGLGRFKEALLFFKSKECYQDSLIKVKEIASLDARFQIEKVQMRNAYLEEKNKFSKVNLVATCVALIFFVLMTFILYRLYRNKLKFASSLESLNRIISRKKKQIELHSQELKAANEHIREINLSLEEKVKQRTERIKFHHRKLKELAFSNSHKLRAPVARIMGILAAKEILHLHPERANEFDYDQLIKESAEELDKIIHRMNKLIEST